MVERRKSTFQKARIHSGEALGLSRRQSEHLKVIAAWRSAAGDALARQVRVVDWLRGTVTLETADSSWSQAIQPLLPKLIAQFCTDLPSSLKVRRFRVLGPGAHESLAEIDVADVATVPTAERAAAPRPRKAPAVKPPADALEPASRTRFLNELRDRYLAAAEHRKS